RVHGMNMQDYVVFPGLVDDVRPILGACDVGFVLSYREALSYACREVMALGLPALVSDVGGLPENVEHGTNGWIVPARTPDAIRGVLQRMLADRAMIARHGAAARAMAASDFAIQPFIDRTREVYHRALQRPSEH